VQWRFPIIDIKDLGNIFYEFIKADHKKINGQIFNIGFNTSNYQVRGILNVISKYFPKCEIIFTGENKNDKRSYKVNFNKLKKLFPQLKQEWPLDKSVGHLIYKLKENEFKTEDFKKEKYIRISNLKSLMERKKINNNLYWLG